ncbi:MAG: ATP-dependent 6-phosphofructokinase [Candidatus Thorarchaeota archaeon]
MRIATLTSGGDAPGMNAVVRAIVRIGCSRDQCVLGIRGGFEGIFNREFVEMFPRSVARIVHRGGTILTTGRSDRFKTENGLKMAASILDDEKIDGLVAIGGDGTMRGLHELQKYWSGQVIGIPASIDNDIYGTDFSIGFDTAVNSALEAIDKIRDTAESFARVFLIEVMGRSSGAIALHVGIACGASAIIIPETPTDLQALADKLLRDRRAGRSSSIVIVAEGDELGNAEKIGEQLSGMIGERCRVSVLGYIQRGGNPSHYDRILGTRLGIRAVECMLGGVTGVMLGEVRGDVVETPLQDVFTKKKQLEQWMLDVIGELST